jgi:hypothetical protein
MQTAGVPKEGVVEEKEMWGNDEPRAGAWYGARLDAKGRDLRSGVRFHI